MPDQDGREYDKRRVAELRPEFYLFVIEALEILPARVLERVMFGIVSLYKHSSREIAAARSARYLREYLKRSLGRAKVRKTESDIYGDHAYQSHVMKVVSLREHLRADKHVDLAGVEGEKRFRHLTAFGHCVPVDTGDLELRKLILQNVLDLFGALADEVEIFAFAKGTGSRRDRRKTAIVKDELRFPTMISERNVAILTTEPLAA